MGLLQSLFGGKVPGGAFGKQVLVAKSPDEIASAVATMDAAAVQAAIRDLEIRDLQADHIRNLFTFGRVCAAYDACRQSGGPWATLPAGFDAPGCWRVLGPRLRDTLKQHSDSSVAKLGAREVAEALIRQSQEAEALELLLAARPGVAPDHEYLVLVCLMKLDRAKAIAQAEAIKAGQLPVPPELEPRVEALVAKLTGEEQEVEPPQVLSGPFGQVGCDRCGQKGWLLPNMRAPTQSDLRPGRKLVCPQCGRVGSYQPAS